MVEIQADVQTLVKKISSKLMCGVIRENEDGILYNVIGTATGVKTGQSNFGEWVALKGEFNAWNDKVNVKSNVIFLPEVATIPLEAALKAGAKHVDFGISVIKGASDSVIGYEYSIKNIIPVKESNRLEDLRERFNSFSNDEKRSNKKKKE